MKFNFNRPLLDLSGAQAVDVTGPITMRRVATMALLGNDDKPTPEVKSSRFALAVKLGTAGDNVVDLSIDEIKLLKDRVSTFGSTLVVGRFSQFIEHPLPEEVAKAG